MLLCCIQNIIIMCMHIVVAIKQLINMLEELNLEELNGAMGTDVDGMDGAVVPGKILPMHRYQ